MLNSKFYIIKHVELNSFSVNLIANNLKSISKKLFLNNLFTTKTII